MKSSIVLAWRLNRSIKAVHGYLIWLELLVEGEVILSLYVSPHQLGRLGKYLVDGKWRGGVVCPQKSQPEHCDIHELDDQAKYRQVLEDIERYKAEIQEYEAEQKPWGNSDWHQRQVSNLEIEALMLKHSTRFGLVFGFWMAKPETEIEWLPDDRQLEAKKFLEATKLAYDIREPDRTETDLTEWKRKLFEV